MTFRYKQKKKDCARKLIILYLNMEILLQNLSYEWAAEIDEMLWKPNATIID